MSSQFRSTGKTIMGIKNRQTTTLRRISSMKLEVTITKLLLELFSFSHKSFLLKTNKQKPSTKTVTKYVLGLVFF